MTPRAYAALLLCLSAFPAGATSTLSTSDLPIEVALASGDFGPQFQSTIEVSYPGHHGLVTLPPSTFTVDDYRQYHGFRLRFDNPGPTSGLPPSFTLEVCGNRAVMTLEGKRHVGCFAWDDDGGGCNGTPPAWPVDTTGCPVP